MKPPCSTLPRVTFIVPVFNDALRLERCLKSIVASSYPPDRFDIIVVDNGSSDGSAEIARHLGATVLEILDCPVAELRNRAARRASGDILAYVDADHEIVSGWIPSAVDTLQLRGVGVAGALCRAPLDGTWVQHAYDYLRGCPRGRHDVDWLGSGNMAVWRSAFESVQGFDTSLETCEDVDLCNRLKASGFRIVSDERLWNTHYGDPATLWDLFRSELWRGRDNLRVSFRRPIAWRSVVSACIPIFDIAIIAAGVLGLIAGGSGGIRLAIAAVLALGLPASVKVARAMRRDGARTLWGVAQALAVACVYDMGRALAVISRLPHSIRRSAVM